MGDGDNTGGPASGAGLIGGLVSGVQGLYQPFINQNWASNAGNQAFDLQRWWAVNAASLAVKGLRKAGLNPILAATRGPSGVESTPVPYASMDPSGDVVGRAVSSAMALSSAKSNLAILRNQAQISEFQKEQERHGVFTAIAGSHEADARAKMAEANRDIVNATKDASITSAKQGAEQAVTTSDSLRTQLELLRAQQPSARALEEFDASPEGQALIKMKRGLELSPKVRGGRLGTFGVE